jgi:hypothetical protein
MGALAVLRLDRIEVGRGQDGSLANLAELAAASERVAAATGRNDKTNQLADVFVGSTEPKSIRSGVTVGSRAPRPHRHRLRSDPRCARREWAGFAQQRRAIDAPSTSIEPLTSW